MRWLVDGNNVIGARPDGWWRDRTGAMARLVAALDAFAAGSGEEVAVVFDGRERAVGQDGAPRVTVGFAPGGRNAADDAVAARVAADGDPATLTVVTSDRELASRVRAAGAHVAGAGGFRDRLPEP
ncbi:NYN domain-containing protein [Conexibacter woesei]|uniref:NYN domain-containing protein n=1 Tax=Conexibacter woesei TaxID=191495 RepID=UPI00047D8EF7|nr:NYN domain-containing protein [Conexibacter woesei]